ncbi:MAG TPA: adenosylcobinamide-phosphate synthase CbiB [Ramlibacter sp.]|nr:adenosylcobinamide-phosphate synthase CbiB [Ramlibacter sp.]
MTLAAMLLLAFGLDRWFGEPPVRWHPVVWMGRYLGWAGSRIAPEGSQRSGTAGSFAAGAVGWCAGAVLVGAAALLVNALLQLLHPVLAALVGAAVLKPMFSWRLLHDEVAAVEQGLSQSTGQGRERLQRLVSRDVTALDDAQVRESAIESLAENLNDSVVAPVFWFLLAGLPGAMLYRFANTADAMWGYRGLRGGRDWTWAGKWAARADDVLSWLPARLTALLLAVAAGGLRVAQLAREAPATPSPNGGWPMGAMALALGVRLRKPGVYALNEAARAPTAEDTARALALAGRATVLLVGAGVAVLLAAEVRP